MKAKLSPLHIVDFAITRLDFDLVLPENSMEDPTSHFHEYEVEIDFDIRKDEYLSVYIKAAVNRCEKKLPGYCLTAEATCVFKFDTNANLPEDVKRSLEGYSTIYIALNSLRGLIANFTANAPFGRYILPSIDLNDLIDKKKELLRKTKSSASQSAIKKRKNEKMKK